MVTLYPRRRAGVTAFLPLAAIALTAPLVTPALAQGPGGGPPFGGGGRGGRMFGGGLVMGTVRQIDRAKNAIQVAGQDGEARWIVLSEETTLTRQVQGTLADLKRNDTIVVSGIPATITAAQIQVGEIPPMGFGGFGGPGGPGGPGGFPGGPGGPGAFGPGGAGRQPGPGAERGGPMAGGQPMARVVGTIASTNPLVVMLPGDLKVTVQAASSTKVTRIVKQTLGDVKAGETILAIGRPDENNVVAAMQVQIGVDLNAGPGFGGPGFGGAFRRGGGDRL